MNTVRKGHCLLYCRQAAMFYGLIITSVQVKVNHFADAGKMV